ncbi:cobalamin biosynthesis protein [Micromonospora sp. NPDC049559]|uniref:cobalamin biosynthesis protein n=1 Tax=Micromonospora sp. NPDC049559 TaxID=3155923 RepID=UPI00343FFFB1
MRLIVGLGARAGVAADELEALVAAVLADAGLEPASVGTLATLDRRAGEPGVVELARRFGWALVGYPAEQLAAEAVPHPSERTRGAVGTPSVAEAAALRAARDATGGVPGRLVVPRRGGGPALAAVAAPTPADLPVDHGVVAGTMPGFATFERATTP